MSRNWGRIALLAGVVCLPLGGQAFAQTERDESFSLGELVVTARARDGAMLGGAEVGSDEMRAFNAQSVDEAMAYVAGANGGSGGGAAGARRNERVIYIRGFDRFQTTLSIDGVRVFLPADNRIDFGRFLTADLAEIQVSKGYVSVLDGPGGLGGAINLVTRNPTQAFDWDIVGSANLDSEWENSGWGLSGRLGTRQERFYAQISGAYTERDHWRLSDDFTPTPVEDGGERDRSDSEDSRYNVRFGFTPNATDEYVISYMAQSGEKRAPYNVNLPLTAQGTNQRYWAWPYWDLESIYFLSTTQLGSNVTLRSRLYSNTFENLLRSFANPQQTLQNHQRAFDSYYDDTAFGGNLQLDATLGENNILRGSLHFRRDQHKERNAPGFAGAAAIPYNEPWQTTEEDTYAVAVENTHSFGENLDWIVGVSYDWTDLRQAEDVSNAVVAGNVVLTRFSYPLLDMDAANWQTALSYKLSDATRVYASVSSRTRFPTQFERFSTRMGTAEPNPTIGPERAINYEIGASADWSNGTRLEGAVFYSDLQDALAPAIVPASSGGGTVTQTQNFASAEYYGAEASLSAPLTDHLRFGSNVTYIKRDYFDPGNLTFQPEGVPEFQLFAYLEWNIADTVFITPSIEFASQRWTANAATPAVPPYYETGDYALLNTSVRWQITPNADLLFGARNLTDQNYQLGDGLPEEGRNFYVSLRLSN